MAIYAYYRYSTDKQTESQQRLTVEKYCENHGWDIDMAVIDRAKSGASEISSRNLQGLLEKMQPGDTLVVSEVSRISRSIQDFCDFLLVVMPKIKARLVVCTLGLDVDCTDINPMTKMQLLMFSMFSQIERDFIQNRVKAGLDAKRREVELYGGWTSKKGNFCTGFGMPNGFAHGVQQMGNQSKIKKFCKGMLPVVRIILDYKESEMDNWSIAHKLNTMGFKTGNGGKFYNYHIPKLMKYYEEGLITE